MNKAVIIQKTIVFVKEKLSIEWTGHDWWHIERVWNNAKAIRNDIGKGIKKGTKIDNFIIDLAVLLHDVGDRKVIHKDEDDYSIAENFLSKNKIDQKTIDTVIFIIKNMSFSNSLANAHSTKGKADEAGTGLRSLEFQIVQDADRLDALGAIGIARAFAFGGNRCRPLYDPTKRSQRTDTKENYRKMNSSTFHHFYEKILLLDGLMNTKSAKRIAVQRRKYLEGYMKQFLLEWDGKR